MQFLEPGLQSRRYRELNITVVSAQAKAWVPTEVIGD